MNAAHLALWFWVENIVSSANNVSLAFGINGMSFVYIKNRVGERYEPWGSPERIGRLIDV